MHQSLTIAVLGCGARGHTCASLAEGLPGYFRLVAGSDPVPDPMEKVRQLAVAPGSRALPDAASLVAAGRMADVGLIAMQGLGWRANLAAAPQFKAALPGIFALRLHLWVAGALLLALALGTSGWVPHCMRSPKV